MKSIKKYLFLLAALAAVFGFVACSDDDDDDDPSVVAKYEGQFKRGEVTVTLTLVCYEDDTFKVYSTELGGTVAEGTYDGNPYEDDIIKVTFTKHELQPKRVTGKPEEFEVRNDGDAIYDPTDDITYFVACSDDDDDDDDDAPSVVAKYEGQFERDGVTVTLTLVCYEDDTFKVYSTELDGTVAEGTYDGNPYENDIIKVTFTKHKLQPERVTGKPEEFEVRNDGDAIYDPTDGITYFVACSDDDDDDDDDAPPVVAKYEGQFKRDGVTVTLTLVCYVNDTFKVYSTELDGTVAEGTYDGNPYENDIIKVTFSKHELQPERVTGKPEELEVKDGGKAIYDPTDGITYKAM